ncbi:MAG: putative glycoside hydrolase [Aerococcus sp.]|nr:putative glycoside hydrolase [Aerococcus sp.]
MNKHQSPRPPRRHQTPPRQKERRNPERSVRSQQAIAKPKQPSDSKPKQTPKQHANRNHTWWKWLIPLVLVLALVGILVFATDNPVSDRLIGPKRTDAPSARSLSSEKLAVNDQPLLSIPTQKPQKFYHPSDVNIAYPKDGVKGIYLSAYGMGVPETLERNLNLVANSALNSVVIDVKSDWGSIATDLDVDNEEVKQNVDKTFDGKQMMKRLEKDQIYPIARITTFKDNTAIKKHPEWSFRDSSGAVWSDDSGQNFLNPFDKDVWKYIVDVAKGAAQLGFQDIQFDYVRFPEGFESIATDLDYDMGDYAKYGKGSVEARQHAIADFLKYANQELRSYGVNVSADLFGYVATAKSAPGIGQNYLWMADNVDHISGMVYPSHWQKGDFGFDAPDLEPYGVIDEYIKAEKSVLSELEGDQTHKTRPWLQSFTADYLPSGTYMEYDEKAVQDQIDALAANGVHEYLLWNARNEYFEDVDYGK